MRPYRSEDWGPFLSLEIETISASLPPEELDIESLRMRWPEVLRSKYEWSDSGPKANRGQVTVIETLNNDYGGHLWVADHEDLFTGVVRCWIVTLAITPLYRGQGLGSRLMQHATSIARARGAKSVGLNVSKSNKEAKSLYSTFGFSEARSTMMLNL